MSTYAPKCPQCGRAYGLNTRKDKSIRCKLCGYEGPAMIQQKSEAGESSSKGTSVKP